MIAAVHGTLVAKMPTAALVLIGGITLRIQISVSCFETLPAVGREVHLLTHLHVRGRSSCGLPTRSSGAFELDLGPGIPCASRPDPEQRDGPAAREARGRT
jgi:hypothetical protein